jgi:hypothetical protein
MTTRTELIEQLRENAPWGANATCDLQIKAADMLEADDQTNEMLLSAARESAARAIAERDKLQEAARLALDALTYQGTMGPTRRQRRAEATTALTETLK